MKSLIADMMTGRLSDQTLVEVDQFARERGIAPSTEEYEDILRRRQSKGPLR